MKPLDPEFMSIIEKLSSASLGFFRGPLWIAALILVYLLSLWVLIYQVRYKTRLLAKAAGETSGAKIRFSVFLESGGKVFANFFRLLIAPAAALVLVALTAGVTGAIRSVNEIAIRQQTINELTVAVKYLEQREKFLDVAILSVQDNATTMELRYTARDSADPAIPQVQWRRTETIAGTDIYFDCLILNFTYSEIGEGRQKNIAIPYRIFSNAVAPLEGKKINEFIAAEIPREDNFGEIPQNYREILQRLLENRDGFMKEAGIRSINGSALHREVRPGERFRLVIEQSGGIRFL
jgi:hypothetical protein